MLLLHRARQQPDGGRSPAAAGDESRRCLLSPRRSRGELRPEPAPCRGPMRGRSGLPARKPSPCRRHPVECYLDNSATTAVSPEAAAWRCT